MKKLVIFDLDGTLMNTKPGIVAGLSYAIEKAGLPVPDEETFDTFIGPPLESSFERVYGLDEEPMQKIIADYREKYLAGDIYQAIPYEGIFDLLAELKKRGIDAAVATYKLESMARELLGKFHFDEYIPFVFGSNKENKLTKGDIILKGIAKSGHTKAETVMVGDSHYDAVGAEEVSVDFIGVLYGFEFKKKEDVDKFANIGASETTKGILDILEKN